MTDNRSNHEDQGKASGPGENSAPGLNNNLDFMGKQLHVQTERIGFPSPHIVTQVFNNGRVVFSKKTEIPAGDSGSQEFTKIQERMRVQHMQIIQEIRDKQKRILNSRAS